MGEKVLIAMSGGVDSSAAALILKNRGYECIGATMKLFSDENEGYVPVGDHKTCCTLDDSLDAKSIAFKLGFPHYVFNFKDEFGKEVIERFVDAYLNDLTPNPCIDCNQYLKFEKLYQRARELGCGYIATGHYANIEKKNGRYVLKKAADASKDQSYVLYRLDQEKLAHTLFPLGNMTKDKIRELAAENGFINADKPDSQDICFIPDGDYASFIERYTKKTFPDGDFLDRDGNVIGRHHGSFRYTIGQRKGLGMGFGKPMYVCAKCAEKNTVTLSENSELFSRELIARDINWIAIESLTGPIRVNAKIRYSHKGADATVYPEGDDIRLVFDEPQRAITPGQAVVMYDGDTVVGGGIIV